MRYLLLLLLSSCTTTAIVSVETTGAAAVRSDSRATLAGGAGDVTIQLLSKTAPGVGAEVLRVDGGEYLYRNRDANFPRTTFTLDTTGTLVLPWHAAQLFPGAQANVPFDWGGVTVRITPPIP